MDCTRLGILGDVGDDFIKAYFNGKCGRQLESIFFTGTTSSQPIDSLWKLLLKGHAPNLNDLILSNVEVTQYGIGAMTRVLQHEPKRSIQPKPHLDFLTMDVGPIPSRYLERILSHQSIATLELRNLCQQKMEVLTDVLTKHGMPSIKRLRVYLGSGNPTGLQQAWREAHKAGKVPFGALMEVIIKKEADEK